MSGWDFALQHFRWHKECQNNLLVLNQIKSGSRLPLTWMLRNSITDMFRGVPANPQRYTQCLGNICYDLEMGEGDASPRGSSHCCSFCPMLCLQVFCSASELCPQQMQGCSGSSWGLVTDLSTCAPRTVPPWHPRYVFRKNTISTLESPKPLFPSLSSESKALFTFSLSDFSSLTDSLSPGMSLCLLRSRWSGVSLSI